MNGLVHFEILALEKPVQNEISVVRRQFCLCFDLGAKNSELLRVLILNSELVAVHVTITESHLRLLLGQSIYKPVSAFHLDRVKSKKNTKQGLFAFGPTRVNRPIKILRRPVSWP